MNSEVIASAIEKYEPVMLEAERFLWKNPELGFREWKTQEYLVTRFRQLGFEVVEAGDIPGFYVDIDTGRPGPTVSILGEMDALPVPDHPECDKETGAAHACGHHCQASALLGIAGALSDPRTLGTLCGKVRVMGVPAEELVDMEFRAALRKKGTIKYLDGKTELLRRGFFDGVDMSVYIHTSSWGSQTAPELTMDEGTVGIILKRAVFTGETSGARPNALYAATTAISAINALREKFEGHSYFIHSIIKSGGQAVNVIPTEVVVENDVRGPSYRENLNANDHINRALAAGALAMGAQVKFVGLDTYLPHSMCAGLDDLFASSAQRRCKVHRLPWHGGGSSDFANLSNIMPTTYGFITGAAGTAHGSDYSVPHPEWAVVESARLQAEFAAELLRGDAEAYREATKDFQPMFPSAQALMADLDRINSDRTCVEYGEGEATVRWAVK